MNRMQGFLTRRRCLGCGARLLLGAGLATASCQSMVWAASKADKRDFFYQDKPKDGKSCAGCKMFSASTSGQGVCAIVDGEIQPNGWCMAYTPRA
jgi:High potential iron-sulfur protein